MSDSVLERLKQGARAFRADVYPDMAEQYQLAAANPQRPHALIIACADSRVAVEKIISWKPGDVFITRNVGNMVPVYGDMLGGVSAVIEFAVTALNIQHVVVCGHSDCGAMKALLDPASVAGMPAVANWVGNGAGALHNLARELAPDELLRSLTERNVLLQIEHLKTHPAVAGAMKNAGLTISGWVYEIGTGEIRIAEPGQQRFSPLNLDLTAGV